MPIETAGARRHHGIDIPAAKMTPVVAVADGFVQWISDGINDGICCSIGIVHEDEWHSLYLHLNNDTWGTDDGLGVGNRRRSQGRRPCVGRPGNRIRR